MAVPLKTENLRIRHAVQSGNQQRQRSVFRQPGFSCARRPYRHCERRSRVVISGFKDCHGLRPRSDGLSSFARSDGFCACARSDVFTVDAGGNGLFCCARREGPRTDTCEKGLSSLRAAQPRGNLSGQSIDRLTHRSRRGFGLKALTNPTIDAHDFNGGQGFGFEAQKPTSVRHAGLPADGKVFALVTVRPALSVMPACCNRVFNSALNR